MKLLVITPTLGRSAWLDQTVASVSGLALDCTHVLVAPAEAVAGLARRFSGAKVVAEDSGNRGMYAAINSGLAASGTWDAMSYINDDDVLLPAFAQNARAAEAAAGTPLIVYGGVRLIDPGGRRMGDIPISPNPALNRALYAQRIEPVYQHGTIATRAALEKLGGFDPSLRFCGDSEFLARACVTGIPFVCGSRQPVAAFRLRPGQLTKNRGEMEAERARVDAKLGLLAPAPGTPRLWPRLVFRLANARIYAERILRHRVISFDAQLAQS